MHLFAASGCRFCRRGRLHRVLHHQGDPRPRGPRRRAQPRARDRRAEREARVDGDAGRRGRARSVDPAFDHRRGREGAVASGTNRRRRGTDAPTHPANRWTAAGDILAQMAGGAGVSPGEMAAEATLTEIVGSALSDLPTRERVEVTWGRRAWASDIAWWCRRQGHGAGVTQRAQERSGRLVRPGHRGPWDRPRRADGFFAWRPMRDTEQNDGGEILSRATEPVLLRTKEAVQGMGLRRTSFFTRNPRRQPAGRHVEHRIREWQRHPRRRDAASGKPVNVRRGTRVQW